MLASLRRAAIVLTALALVPAGAHLFAMPNKLPMSSVRVGTVGAVHVL